MKIKLGVFFGGKSVEHEVSIITALQAIENIDTNKYEVIPIFINKDYKMYCGDFVGDIKQYKNVENLISMSNEVTLAQRGDKVILLKSNKKFYEPAVYDYIDIAFPIVHGTNVEDGTLQGYLKMFNLPYVGCDVTSSAVGMDKYVCKCVLKESGIPVLDCICFTLKDYDESIDNVMNKIENKFNYPVIIKPVNLGSSVGISIAKDRTELEESIKDAFRYAKKILVERAVKNLKEVNCSVIGDYEEAQASELEEPIKTDEILSFNDKYISGGKKLGAKNGGGKMPAKNGERSMNSGVLKLPAEVDSETRAKVQELALKTFEALGCSGVIRIDFIIDEDSKEIFVNEVNTIPGSLSFHLWKATGVNYTDELNKIIDLSLKRAREEKNMTFSFDSNILAGYTEHGLGGSKGGKMKLQ